MKDVKIFDNELQEMRQIAKSIEKCIGDTYQKCLSLQGLVEAGEWSGETRDSFYMYLVILQEYHRQLHDISKMQTLAFDNLDGYFDDFHSHADVQKVKSL